jgi:hypothetical protein
MTIHNPFRKARNKIRPFMFVVVLLLAGSTLLYKVYHYSILHRTSTSFSEASVGRTDEILGNAFKNHESNVQVQGQGEVVRILPDDIKGIPHQRFIIKLASGQTVLISHNIEIAQRIDGLRVGDEVQFSGEYEWNEQGGLIHYTHRDPSGRHDGGWLECKGQRHE